MSLLGGTGITESRLEISRGALSFFEALPAHGTTPRGTVLMVPGYTGSKEDFLPLAPFVTAAGYRLLAYSQLGQYDSDGPDGEGAETEYTIEKFASDLGEVCSLVSNGERIHLLGHSFGGLVTRFAVLSDPTRFLDYTILASGPSGGDTLGAGLSGIPALLREGGNEAMWQSMSEAIGDLFPAPLKELLHTRILATRTANLIGIATTVQTEPDRVAELAATALPILVCYGENDFAWPIPVMAGMAERLGARHVVIPGAGHTPNEEVPEQLAEILVEFWDAHAG